jgi:YD repeat-containing protein
LNYAAPFGIDPTNRVREVKTPDDKTKATQYAASWTHVIDQEGNKTSTQRDFLERETARVLYSGVSTPEMQYSYTYDGLDRLLTTTVGGSTVTNFWDPLGRRKRVDDPDSGTWATRYDLAGNPILWDDPKTGQRTEACYDKLNRVVLQCSYPSDGTTPTTTCGESPSCGRGGTQIAFYLYDSQPPFDSDCGGAGPIGHLTWAVDSSGGECFAYDIRGRVTTQKKTIVHNGVSTTAKTVFTYDEADHVIAVRYPDDPSGSNPVEHGYQADGLPDSIEQVISDTEYDLFGRITKITSLHDTEDVFGYDADGSDNFRLKTIQTKRISAGESGEPYLNLSYAYWPRGKVRVVIDPRDQGTARSNAAGYCYDGLGRLTKVVRDPIGVSFLNPCAGTPEETFDHNSDGNLESKNGTFFGFNAGPHQPTSFGDYTSIHYDANGSRIVKSKGGGNTRRVRL